MIRRYFPGNSDLMSLTSAARYAMVSRTTIRRWIDAGLPAHRVGPKLLRIDRAELDAFLGRDL